MAGKNVFLLLQVYGTKIGKFKQGVLLPAANATVVEGHKLLSDEELQTVRTGACLTITMTWLRTIMTGKPFTYDKVPNDQNAALVKFAATAGKVHGKMKQKATQKSAHEVRLDLAKRLGVPLTEDRCITDTTFANATNAVLRVPVGHGGLVSSKVHRHSDGNYIGRHATGLHINKPAHLRFFDPNVGEYEVAFDMAPRFFEAYREALSETLDQDFRSTDLYMAKLT